MATSFQSVSVQVERSLASTLLTLRHRPVWISPPGCGEVGRSICRYRSALLDPPPSLIPPGQRSGSGGSPGRSVRRHTTPARAVAGITARQGELLTAVGAGCCHGRPWWSVLCTPTPIRLTLGLGPTRWAVLRGVHGVVISEEPDSAALAVHAPASVLLRFPSCPPGCNHEAIVTDKCKRRAQSACVHRPWSATCERPVSDEVWQCGSVS